MGPARRSPGIRAATSVDTLDQGDSQFGRHGSPASGYFLWPLQAMWPERAAGTRIVCLCAETVPSVYLSNHSPPRCPPTPARANRTWSWLKVILLRDLLGSVCSCRRTVKIIVEAAGSACGYIRCSDARKPQSGCRPSNSRR